MRLLLVEDDIEIAAVFEQEFSGAEFELHHVATRDEALALLGESTFDVAVCDLRIPSAPGAFDEDVAHGRAVLTNLIESHPGTPVIAFSAYGTVELMQELLTQARQEDFLGEGSPREMLIFFSKDQLPDCVSLLHEIGASIRALDEIEIATGLQQLDLTWEHERILRVYGRRLGATVVRASPLTGGLSGSRVLRLRLESAGAHVASVVAKLDSLARVAAEQQKVEKFVAPALPAGAYPSAVTLVRAGAGGSGGLFYSFAGGFARSLFDAIRQSSGAPVAARVRDLLNPWREGAPVEQMELEQIRGQFIDLSQLPAEHASVVQNEHIGVSVRRCTGHCDLHAFNVLLSDGGEPMVIDFAAVSPAPASMDPISLELSLVFHPDARDPDSWPSIEQAEHWDELDRYVDGCPDPEYVNACRQWAFDVAAGDREVFASLYAYALRQLKFPDIPVETALALIRCAQRRLGL